MLGVADVFVVRTDLAWQHSKRTFRRSWPSSTDGGGERGGQSGRRISDVGDHCNVCADSGALSSVQSMYGWVFFIYRAFMGRANKWLNLGV